MKKILEKTVFFMIGSFITVPINYLIVKDWMHAFIISLSISIAYLIATILIEYVTIKNIKKVFWWVKNKFSTKYYYKHDGRFMLEMCPIEKCMIGSTSCQECEFCEKIDTKKCCIICKHVQNNRSYNILKWLKKLFILCVISILSVGCVTINVYKEPTTIKQYQNKTTTDTIRTESVWY